jgi:hypothetical protein
MGCADEETSFPKGLPQAAECRTIDYQAKRLFILKCRAARPLTYESDVNRNSGNLEGLRGFSIDPILRTAAAASGAVVALT